MPLTPADAGIPLSHAARVDTCDLDTLIRDGRDEFPYPPINFPEMYRAERLRSHCESFEPPIRSGVALRRQAD
jgi:hypothetical protein